MRDILGSSMFQSCRNLTPTICSRLLRIILASPELQFSKIDLSECGLDSDSMSTIIEGLFPISLSIRHLYLDSNSIKPSFCTPLFLATVAKQITHLTLADNLLGDEGAVLIASMLKTPDCKIEYLDLSSNNIHTKGAEAITDALQQHSSLQWLSLQFNVIGDTGLRNFGLALRKNRTLKSLFLAHNFITDRSQESLLCGLCLNTTISELHMKENFLSQPVHKSISNLVRNRFVRIQIQPIVALAYGSISRLGRNSPLFALPSDVLRRIHEMTVLEGYPTPSQIYAADPWSSYSDSEDSDEY